MNIREMFQREEFIKDTIEKLSEKVKNANSDVAQINVNTIYITAQEAQQIATCLDWLEQIFTVNINHIDIDIIRIEDQGFRWRNI